LRTALFSENNRLGSVISHANMLKLSHDDCSLSLGDVAMCHGADSGRQADSPMHQLVKTWFRVQLMRAIYVQRTVGKPAIIASCCMKKLHAITANETTA